METSFFTASAAPKVCQGAPKTLWPNWPIRNLTNDEFKRALNYTSLIIHATLRGVHASRLAFCALLSEVPVSSFAVSRPRKV